MKKHLLPIFLIPVATSFASAEEAQPGHKHTLETKGFYRYHDEKGYQYKSAGIGLSYVLDRPYGLGLHIDYLNNLKSTDGFFEMETTLMHKKALSFGKIVPFYSSKIISHKRDSKEKKIVYITKSTVSLGVGLEKDLSENILLKVHASLFKDVNNALIVYKGSSFWGKNYSNPEGAKIKIGISSVAAHPATFFGSVSYAHTFQKCYKECEVQLGVRWVF